jgi:hypothetical protein
MIKDNYIGPHQAKAYLSQTINGAHTEAAIELNDVLGYRDRSKGKALKDLRFSTKEVRRNFDVVGLNTGLLHTQEMLDFDIVRLNGNILTTETLDLFTLEEKDGIVENGDSIMIIHYQLPEPTLASTGDVRCTSYEGLLFINTQDYAIVRNEIQVKSSAYYHGGRGTMAAEKSINNRDYHYQVITSYRKFNNLYGLSKIEYKSSYQNLDQQEQQTTINLVIFQSEAGKTDTTAGRDYFNKNEENANFWKRFNIPK